MYRGCEKQKPQPHHALTTSTYRCIVPGGVSHASRLLSSQLREKREELNKSIASDEEEKAKIQNDLRILTERLSRINDNLARKIASRTEYDKTITETEAAYQKVAIEPRLIELGA